VHHANAKVRLVLAEKRNGCKGLERRDVTGTSHDYVGRAIVVAGPLPYAESRGAVQNRRVDLKPIRRWLLSRDDEVDVVAAAEAVIGNRQQCISIRRKIDADDIGFLIGYVIDKAGVLVGEAVVVLAPNVGGEKIV